MIAAWLVLGEVPIAAEAGGGVLLLAGVAVVAPGVGGRSVPAPDVGRAHSPVALGGE